ncbi:MAG: hypothetical protein A2126_04675 [Candidatus Woykebacteria bacterium GWB1_45_5]|uniref:R3H domain-containing protein n=2 Tax=Candidatus Woykeibacteriota TaxID=1817899 RepID=A0A1G1W473_9BACT|nr:MAG: hypothetical protein A2113_01710 [Candidatus Woykebacteria bacterium GWA1_44_8]OGY22570.1 MAG: hypothetical protein A2126_04675 [Candidatus Woykebacteria bacterium GWB1_45_5]
MAAEKPNEKIEKEAQDLIAELIKMLGIEAKAQVTVSSELIKIDIDGQDLGLLIGRRGENIESLQLLLGLILNKKLSGDTWQPVLIDVGGWRKAQEESLRSLVERQVAKLSAGRGWVELPPMPPAQRRVVHVLVSEHKGLESESTGEEPNRFVVIKSVGKG